MTKFDVHSSFLDNIVSVERRARTWNGVSVEDRQERAKGWILNELVSETETGLTINLSEVGGATEPRLKRNQPCPVEHRPNHMALIPKGMRMWGFTAGIDYCHYAVLLFDVETLVQRFQEDFVLRTFERPKLRFAEPRILALVRMLIEISGADAAAQLLGDSLTAAIFGILSADDFEVKEAKRLAPWQVRRAIDYMNDQLPRQIELQELAELAGQSQWHFCRAFKASTGLSPYQWQLEQRINMSKQMLLGTDVSLDTVANATGFGDAMHFSRTFRRRVGATPAAWRRENG